MSNVPRKDIVLREYDNQKDLATRVDTILKAASTMVEKEFGTEAEGVTFMPTLNVVCKLKDDPTSDVDPVSFSVVKRPNTATQIDAVVHNILLKDPAFLSSIMHGLANQLSEMMAIHADMSSLVNSMGEMEDEETEVETVENEGKNPESQGGSNVQRNKKSEVN